MYGCMAHIHIKITANKSAKLPATHPATSEGTHYPLSPLSALPLTYSHLLLNI